VDLDGIRRCLETDGWAVEPLSESTLRTRFRCRDGVLNLLVHEAPRFVTFAVVPFARLPDDPEAADALADRLLRLNREMNFAKFAVDEDGDVLLCVEYRLSHLDPSEVRDAIDVLSFYADRHYAEVRALAGRVSG
jgi:hypothetical protein